MSFVAGFFLLLLVMGIPTGFEGLYDGLPWSSHLETLTIFVLLPFLMISGYRFLSLRWSTVYLVVFLLFKLIMYSSAPASGWMVKVYPRLNLTEVKQNSWHPEMYEAVTSGDWVETYATRWNENASGILQNAWNQKSQFPMDWFLPHGVSPKNVTEQFDEVGSWVQFEGVAILPKGTRLIVVAQGVVDGSLEASSSANEKVVVPIAKDFKKAAELANQMPVSGRVSVEGKFRFEGTDWSFILLLIDGNGKAITKMDRMVFFQDRSTLHLTPTSMIGFKILSWLIDIGIGLFFLVWIVWVAWFLLQNQILSLGIVLFSTVTIIFSFAMGSIFNQVAGLVNFLRTTLFNFKAVDISAINNVFHLGFSIVLAGVVFFIWASRRNDCWKIHSNRIDLTVFLLYGPAILVFFSYKWIPQIGHWSLWSLGDDWTTYQVFARKIVVDEEWLTAGEGVFIMQPLYRYFVGIYHWLFGQSAFVQRMADVWCILGATVLLANWIVKFRVTPIIAFLISTMYLMINFIGTFRYRIGEGLVENHAMIFMMIAAWFMYSARMGGKHKIILATLFGILGYWVRQDHLGASAGIALLILEPVGGSVSGLKIYWDQLKLRWKQIAIYWGGGLFSVLLICFRNWWLGGDFYLTKINHPNFDSTVSSPFPGSFYIVLTGNPWPTFPNIAGFVMTIGTLIGLLALVWRPNALQHYPRSLGMIFIGLLLPYVFIWNWVYEPRFSIHLLPLALLSWAILLNFYFKRFKFFERFQ